MQNYIYYKIIELDVLLILIYIKAFNSLKLNYRKIKFNNKSTKTQIYYQKTSNVMLKQIN